MSPEPLPGWVLAALIVAIVASWTWMAIAFLGWWNEATQAWLDRWLARRLREIRRKK